MIFMNHNTNVKYTTLEDFVTTVNDLGVELVIDEALREARKKKLETLIDEALVNKNEKDFKQYTDEYKKYTEKRSLAQKSTYCMNLTDIMLSK